MDENYEDYFAIHDWIIEEEVVDTVNDEEPVRQTSSNITQDNNLFGILNTRGAPSTLATSVSDVLQGETHEGNEGENLIVSMHNAVSNSLCA